MDATHLTKAQRDELLAIADKHSLGGQVVPFPTRLHRQLKDRDFVEFVDPRVRCTPEGLEAAREIQEREEVA